MNWENITYIFQIPITWYEKIHKRVFGAYGTNFIRVRDGDDGEMQIDVDEDSFAQAVGQYVIDLSSYVTLDTDQTITGEKTFTQSINLSSYGTLSAGAQRLNLTHGANGISLSGTSGQLLTNEPDYLYSTGADNQIASRGYCRLNFARVNHTHGNIANNGQITADSGTTPTEFYIAADSNGNLYRKNTTGLVPSLSGYVKSVNNTKPDENGNVELEIPGLSGVVYSVNHRYPDANGNVNLGRVVYSVNNTTPDENGNVTLQISSITMQDVEDYVDDRLTDYVQQGDLTGYVKQSDLTSYATQDDITSFVTDTEMENYVDLQLLDYVKTVDGVSPDANGNVSFGLGASKWMKTDSNGHIATTNETPIFLSAGNTGYLYANNGSLEFKNDEYVTLSTQQDISGKKRFTQNDVTILDNSLLVIDSQTNNGTSVSKKGVTINSSTPFIDFSTPGTAANDAFIAMTAASGYRLGVQSPHGIDLEAPVNQAKLAKQPTDTDSNSLAIATCGYVQSCLSGYTTPTTMQIVTDVTWNGTTLQKKTRNLTIKQGLITNIGTETTTTIDTPVAYSTT